VLDGYLQKRKLTRSQSINLQVGALNSGNNFNGTIDEVYIFNRTLSAEQVNVMYEASAYGHSVLAANETSQGYEYVVEVTPNDGIGDGISLNSSVLTVFDSDDPPVITITSNSTEYRINETVQFNGTFTDDINLSSYTFSWNDTGVWINVSNVSISGASYIALENQSISAAQGTRVHVKYYANDSIGNWTESELIFVSGGSHPTHTTPILNATDNPANKTSANLTAYNQSTVGTNTVINTYAWYENNAPMIQLLMTFNSNLTTNDVVKDYSGLNNQGTITGAVTNASGLNGSAAYNFDADGDYITVAEHDSLKPENITVAAWVYPDAMTSWDTILMKSTSSSWNDGYGLAHYSTGTEINFFVTLYSANAVTSTINLNEWSFVVGTYDGQELKLYVNGTLADNKTYTDNITHSTNDLLIGQGTGSSAYSWDGLIDEVSIWNRSLSAEQIREMYLAGASGYQVLVSNETAINKTYYVDVTPNDGVGDGQTLSSNSLFIIERHNPTHTAPVLNAPEPFRPPVRLKETLFVLPPFP